MRVVPSSFLRVGKDLVSRLDFGEFASSSFDVVVVAVRMKLESLFTVRSLDSFSVLVKI